MKNEAIVKIQKFGKVGHTITKVAIIISIMLLVLLTGTAISLASLHQGSVKIYESSQLTLEFHKDTVEDALLENAKYRIPKMSITWNDIEHQLLDMEQDDKFLRFSGESETKEFEFMNLSYFEFIVSIWLALELVVLFFLKRICKALSVCETPFSETVIDSMQKLSISLIPVFVYSLFKDSLIESLMYGEMSLGIEFDFFTVLMVVLVFLLTFIFKYGAMLQQESDETL